MFRRDRLRLEKGIASPRDYRSSPVSGPLRGGTAVLHPPATPRAATRAPQTAPPGTRNINPTLRADEQSVVRKAAFFFGLIFIFIRFSLVNEILAEVFGVNTYVLLVFAGLSLLGVLVTGGIRRTLAYWPTRLWVVFALWMVLTVPMSSWPSDSLKLVTWYLRTELPVMFVIAGLAVGWREFRAILLTLAASGVVNELFGRTFSQDSHDRLNASAGSIGNANDFAAHLLLMLPFLIYCFIEKRSVWRRVLMLLALLTSLFFVMKTGSRGALLALIAGVLFVLWRSPRRVRLGMMIGLPAVALLILALLPGKVLERYGTILSGAPDDDVTVEAIGSKMTRMYLLRMSVQLTAAHPLFGVGPGQFANSEGLTAREAGQRGAWQVTHNSYTQASSELGVPGFLLAFAAIVSSFLLVNRIYREARARPGCEQMAAAGFCLLLSILLFCIASFFLSMMYRFYFPALSGLAAAYAAAVRTEFVRGQRAIPRS